MYARYCVASNGAVYRVPVITTNRGVKESYSILNNTAFQTDTHGATFLVLISSVKNQIKFETIKKNNCNSCKCESLTSTQIPIDNISTLLHVT